MKASTSADWIAAVGCNGGPIMLLGVDALVQWTGATPFTSLRKRSAADADRFANRRNVLHFWGNLGGAGEQFLECDSEADALAQRDALRAKIEANCPGVVVDQADDRVQFRDPKSGGQLCAELEPKSEYDASWQTHPDDDAWLHPFGKSSRALFWFVGKVVVHVARIADDLVLLTHTVQGPKTAEADRAAALQHVSREPPGTPISDLELPPRAAVWWAPIAPDTIDGFDLESAARAGEPAIVRTRTHTPARDLGGGVIIPATESIETVGAVFDVHAGRYAVSLGSVEPDKTAKRHWSARWCRLTRV